MTQTTRDMILLIEVQDMKHRYRHGKYQKKRINAYIKSLEISSGVDIIFCEKEHKILEFTLKGGQSISKEAQKNVREIIQGEMCSPEARKKYDMPVQWLPHEKVHQVNPSHEAWKEMTVENQEQLQHRQRQAKEADPLTIDAVEKHNLKKSSGPIELRQFACAECHRSWWRTVFKIKPVSRCRGRMCGAKRYDALHKMKEFGIGRFICPNPKCQRQFYGHCEAMDKLNCRKCNSPVQAHIHPKWTKKARRKKLNPEAKAFKPRKPAKPPAMPPPTFGDLGPKFEPIRGEFEPKFEPVSSYMANPVVAAACPMIGASLSDLVNPIENLRIATTPRRGRPKKEIFNPSTPHDSTGSTVSTFLSQRDSEKEEVDLDYDNEIDDYVPGACRFECTCCDNEYTVVCRMVDTALCFKCKCNNSPLGRSASNEIDRKTDNKHSCSRCCENGICPNLQEARFAREEN